MPGCACGYGECRAQRSLGGAENRARISLRSSGLRLLPLFHMAWAQRLHRHPQAPDFLPPFHRKAVAVGVAAFMPHSAHAERQLVLRVHECRRGASSHRVDTAGNEHAVCDDVPVLARTHRPPDFPGQLLADHPPFPHAASPQRKRRNQKEWQ